MQTMAALGKQLQAAKALGESLLGEVRSMQADNDNKLQEVVPQKSPVSPKLAAALCFQQLILPKLTHQLVTPVCS